MADFKDTGAKPPKKSTLAMRADYKPVLHDGEIIVAFDPGVTTGVALVRYMGTFDQFEVQQTSEITWENRIAQVAGFVGVADHIVVESFRLYANKAEAQINNSFPSSQVIGIIDTWAWMYNKLERITEQPAIDIARVQVLDQHKAMVGDGSEHRKDAYKHARRFIIAHYATKAKGG